MSQVVLKLPKSIISQMKNHYKHQLTNPPQYAAFAAKTPYCSITGYNSGKVLFQGKSPEKEAEKWGDEEQKSSAAKKSSSLNHAFAPPESLFLSSHIGSDEAGTGDYFGPITVAAVYVKEHQLSQLKAIGVRDSKHLKDPQIKELAKQLVELDIPYSLLRLSNNKYNQWQTKGFSQGKMKTLLHYQAINKLLEKIAPEIPAGMLVDQFADPAIYQKHLKSEGLKLQENVYFMTKAESFSTAVAAASIIARSSFVKAIAQLEMDLGLDIPKGASAKVDQAASEVIKHYGEEKLLEIAKVHFANTQKAKKFL
ncbi:ribonuclease HIII [Halobacillus salinarum]|uniref:Ribonuclease HIII n=1 Tax=Halobacillus salinarum TaxID=2932257 RepID=A0ABY4EPV2_9BACI|nr:ribonuclease HIII [Halobacillus salinarum]UOQ46198.1 ribonuclease HIII [Halobacillus salinarum]